MMFLQLLPELLKQDLFLILVVPNRLQAIYARSFPQCRVLSNEDAEETLQPEELDLQLPVGPLPQYLLSDWVDSGRRGHAAIEKFIPATSAVSRN